MAEAFGKVGLNMNTFLAILQIIVFKSFLAISCNSFFVINLLHIAKNGNIGRIYFSLESHVVLAIMEYKPSLIYQSGIDVHALNLN